MQREGHVNIQGEDGFLQAKEKTWAKTSEGTMLPIPDLTLPASRTVKKSVSIV